MTNEPPAERFEQYLAKVEREIQRSRARPKPPLRETLVLAIIGVVGLALYYGPAVIMIWRALW